MELMKKLDESMETNVNFDGQLIVQIMNEVNKLLKEVYPT